jgi:hypothetical protein
MRPIPTTLCATGTLILAGCYANPTPSPTKPVPPPSGGTAATPAAPEKPAKDPDAEIKAERAKLSPEDRALVEAQEWCVETNDRLGKMGPPIKIMIKDKPVFLCCDGCEDKAKADPDKTLAKVEELKAKKKAQSEKK